MSDYVLAYIASLAFISFLLWVYPTYYRIIKTDIDKEKLSELEAKVNKVIATVALRGGR